MSSPALPPIGKFAQLSAASQGELLDILFEPSEDLRQLLVPTLQGQSFESYPALIAAVNSQLRGLLVSPEAAHATLLDAILGSHPRLGEKKVDSAQSQVEQAQLQSKDEGESQTLVDANRSYEMAFPGLRYVVFVNGRSRSVLLNDIQQRIQRHDARQERLDAIKAICDIAEDRATKLIPQKHE